MNKVTQSIIDSLTEPQDKKVLTLYLPVHKISTPATTKEDQARYRNMIADGIEKWEAAIGPEAIKASRMQLEAKLDDAEFWNETQKSLAIFASSEAIEFVHLPIESSEYVYVGANYDLAPMRVALSHDQPYYLLTLAKHHPKLFKGDSYGLEIIDLNFPDSPEDALNIDEMFSGSNTVRGVGTQGGGNDMLSTHGQGDSNHAGQEEHLKYLRIIDDKIINSPLIDRKVPLLVAATESEASDFKHISNYPSLITEYVAGNHTLTPLQELHELSWEVIANVVVGVKVAGLIERFNEDKGRQKASSDLAEIAEAVTAGRVDTLLLGIVEKTNDSVSDAGEIKTPLLRLTTDYATSHMCELVQDVVAQGGSIVGVDPEALATPSMVAALYRY
jgi:hypothetical protein